MKQALSIARVEKDVENAYREAIRKGRPDAIITSPHGTDGFATWEPSVRLLLEAKYDLDFKARVPVCSTLGQCLLYLKKFEASGEPVPNVILVGDRNECFVLSTIAVKGFLDLTIDWSVAPSKGNPDLTRALVEGMNILPYVYDVDGNFKFRDVLDKIDALAEGERRSVKATLTNIGAIFTYWKDRVFSSGPLTAVEQVDVFLKCLFQPTDVYLHPTKMGVLVVPGYPDGVPVSAEQYRSFFAHFEQGYPPSKIEGFYANKDRLVEDDARRRQGAFFTPDLWVAQAHARLDKVLGPTWRDECIVWDPAAGTANDAGTKGTSKAGIAKTVVNEQMKKAKLGAPSQQLYAQFMFQASVLATRYGFAEHTTALFSKPTFMSSGSYRKFRQWWYGRYEAQAAFLFQASHFADVSGRWGISFTIWNSPGKTHLTDPIPCDLLDEPKGTFKIESIDTKSIYNSDGREASKWVREPLGKAKGEDAPQFSSGLKVKDKGRGSLVPGALYFFGNNANNLQDSGTLVYNVSSADTRNHGLSVTPSNFRRATALYGARKLVSGDWVNDKDEYLTPTSAPEYESWVDDCHVYAILHNSNNCTAMRNVDYKEKKWTIHNHFFWKSQADTLAALDTKATPNLYRDCKAHPSKDVFGAATVATPDPYMAHVLPGLNLSPEARSVLDKLDALWTLSLPLRESCAAGKPELHLMAWDAGTYQCKHLWKGLYSEEWADLQASFKVLAAKLRPGVYEHGFLLPWCRIWPKETGHG